MKIDQNGIPSLVTENTATDGTAIGEAVTVPAVPVTTFGTLVNDLLTAFQDKAEIIVDPVARKVWARSDAALLTAKMDLEATKTVVLTPDSGQTGKSLTFTAGSTTGVDADIVAAITAAIGTQKPKRSVQSLVSSILSADFTGTKPVIGIDQNTGVVKVYEIEDADAALAIVNKTGAGVDQVAIQFSEGTTPAADPLIFEGGATAP